MKHYFLSLLVLVSIIVPVASNLIPGQALAATSCPGDIIPIQQVDGGAAKPSATQVGICLTDQSGNAISGAGYSVNFTYTNSNNQTFKNISAPYNSKYNAFLTGPLNLTGGGSDCATSVKQAFTANVTKNGKSYASPYSTNLCTQSTNNTFFNKVMVSQSVVQDGYIGGTLTYSGADGSQQPFVGTGSDPAVGEITSVSDPSKTFPQVRLDAQGNISETELPVGKYTFTINNWLTPANSSGSSVGDVSYTKTFTVTSADTQAKPYDLSHNVTTAQSGSQQSQQSGGTSPPTCDTGSLSLAWIMCPLIRGLASAADDIYARLIKPLLVVPPIDTSSSSRTYEVWSDFRLYGDIFLLIALLVIVFGESIGGGLIDAYSAKKILPRLLAAAILINLSIYLVAIAVDIGNIVGGGIAGIIEYPFKNSGTYTISMSGSTGALGLGALAAGSIWAIASIGPLLSFLFIFFLVPAFLTLVAILVTVFLRQGLIILLVMISPVAFALYCLPNTEKYFKQWWDLLFRTILVYPIIATLFATANVLAVTINETATQAGSLEKPLIQLMSMIALFVPLFLIPFSFRIAGGLIGKFHEFATSARKRGHQAYLGNENDPWSRRNRAKYGMADRNTRSRERVVNWSKTGAQVGAFGVGRRSIGRALNTGNLQAQRSRFNRERSEILASQIATGDDSNIRDLFIAWDGDANGGKGGWFRRMDMENGHAVAGASAIYDNYAVGNNAHKKSLSLYGKDQSSIQEGLYYEWKKTGFEPVQMERLEKQYDSILDDVGLNETEGAGVMKGVGFRHAPQSLISKYSTFTKDKATQQWGWKRDRVGLAKEFANNVDLYGASKQDRSTYDSMGDGYEVMRDTVMPTLPAGAVDSSGTLQPQFVDQVVSGPGIIPEFQGKTYGQVHEAMRRIEDVADAVIVDSRGGSGPVLNVPQEDGGQPVFGGGMRGISNAPVDVQKAANAFAAKVRGPQQAPQRRQPPAPPAAPGTSTGGGTARYV